MFLLFHLGQLNDHLFWKELFTCFTCSFSLLCVSFVNTYQFVCVLLSLLFLRVGCRIWLYCPRFFWGGGGGGGGEGLKLKGGGS